MSETPEVPAPAKSFGGTSLTEGTVRGQLLKLSGFMAVGIIASLISTLADTYFIAKLGTHELAALTFSFPVVMLVISLSIGFGTGVVSVISRSVGEGDQGSVRALGTDAILLATLLTAIISIIGYNTIDPLFRLLGAEEAVLPLIHDYMQIWYLGTLFQIIPQVGSSVIRAHGDARTPSALMALAAIINAVLDPILIFGWGPIPAMGIAGAAWAGNFARLALIIMFAIVIYRGMHALAPISFSPERLKKSWGRLLHIALPSTATQLVSPLASAIITAIVASYGTFAVAAFGIATRVEIFAYIYVMAIAIAVAPFVGQNAGAKRMDRVREAISFSVKFCFIGGLILTVLLALSGHWLVTRFATEPEVIRLATLYFFIVPVSYAFGGVVAVAMSVLNSLAKPLNASMVGLARSMLVTVPLVFIGSHFAGMEGIFIANSVAGVVVGFAAWWLMLRAVREKVVDVPEAAEMRPTAAE
jgi:putative MATE family efflux protein